MKCLVWNVRGFNHPLKQKAVIARIHKLHINFVCLLETRVKQNKVNGIVKNRFNGWNMFHNYSEAYNGRIWMLWADGFKVNLLAVSDQSILCCVEINRNKFYFSAI